MSLLANLGIRGRLLRTALTKRFVYNDIIELAVAYGHLPITDVEANHEPIAFLRKMSGENPTLLPDFSEIAPSRIRSHASAPSTWSSEKNAAEFVGRFAAILRARTVCEIGCFIGYTTVHIATALRAAGTGARLYYVDLDPRHLATATANLKQFGLDSFGTAVLGGSCDTDTLSRMPTLIDLVFIDTTHSYNDTVAEIAAYGPRLSPQGCLVLHDSIRYPGVRQAISEVRDRFDVFTFATELGNGISVLTHRR